jgi:hypothetical protein
MTIFLHNKAKLFQSGNKVKTKEEMENELNEEKVKIIENKRKDRHERLKRFMKTD